MNKNEIVKEKFDKLKEKGYIQRIDHDIGAIGGHYRIICKNEYANDIRELLRQSKNLLVDKSISSQYIYIVKKDECKNFIEEKSKKGEPGNLVYKDGTIGIWRTIPNINKQDFIDFINNETKFKFDKFDGDYHKHFKIIDLEKREKYKKEKIIEKEEFLDIIGDNVEKETQENINDVKELLNYGTNLVLMSIKAEEDILKEFSYNSIRCFCKYVIENYQFALTEEYQDLEDSDLEKIEYILEDLRKYITKTKIMKALKEE